MKKRTPDIRNEKLPKMIHMVRHCLPLKYVLWIFSAQVDKVKNPRGVCGLLSRGGV